MKIYTLKSKQKLPISVEEAWQFLSDPKNLKRITPEYMGFDIISGGERAIYAGQLIQYIVTPLFGIKTKWVTEITHVVEGKYFVDEQRFGPYSLWHHTHFLNEIEGGVEMEDIVNYKLPFGFLGTLVHPFLVKPKLTEIFEHRTKTLIHLFGEYKPNEIRERQTII